MPFSWSSKNPASRGDKPSLPDEPGVGPSAAPAARPPADARPGALGDLLRPLAQAGSLLGQSAERLADHLAHRDSWMEQLGRETADISTAVARLQEQLDRGFQQLAQLLSTPAVPTRPLPAAPLVVEPAEEPSTVNIAWEASPGADAWEQAILGPRLMSNRSLASEGRRLLEGVLGGDGGAATLAGLLLVFRSAATERLAQLLKDIGEAYYRWQPKTRDQNHPFEEALAASLQEACEAAGLFNTIELVHPGQRFDMSRHHAASPGVEITAVGGWIVLRDNGKVYTKAAVTVR